MIGQKHILVLTLISATLGGCKFGNYSQDPTVVSVNGVKTIETFPATAKTLKTLVAYKDVSGTYTSNENDAASLTAVPLSILGTFTQVVQLFIMSDPTKSSVFASMFADPFNSGSIIPAQYDATGHFTLNSQQVSGFYFGPDASCSSGVFITEDGTINHNHPTVVTFPDGSHVTTSGTLSVTVIEEQLFTDGCGPYLQRLASCFQTNGSGCTAQEIADAQLFQLYATETNVVDLTKASTIKELAYSVLFQ